MKCQGVETHSPTKILIISTPSTLFGQHYLSSPEVRAEDRGYHVDDDDGVLCLRDIYAAHFERSRDVGLPMRTVE